MIAFLGSITESFNNNIINLNLQAMKKIMRSTFGRLFNKNWVLVATRPMVLTMVFCGTTLGLTACKEAKAQEDNPVQHPEIPLE